MHVREQEEDRTQKRIYKNDFNKFPWQNDARRLRDADGGWEVTE